MRVVCLHGWSGSIESMRPLSKALTQQLGSSLIQLELGQYTSLDDDLTLDDLATAMMNAWIEQRLPTAPQSINIIVHSMGALVLRHWIRRYFTPDTLPIARCVMLAPANFGSVLAHQGSAVLGRLFKGFHFKRPFQVGSQLLDVLELGSPWTVHQALEDCFNQPIFNTSHILTTILIGSEGHRGLGALLNEPCSDGVVRWSSAHLEPVRYCIDLSSHRPEVERVVSGNQVAYQIISGLNHASILQEEGSISSKLIEAIIQGLKVTPQTFQDWRHVCENKTDAYLRALDSKALCQQHVVSVINQYTHPVTDYCMTLTEQRCDDHHLTEYFQSHVHLGCHVYRNDKSFRSFYWDVGAFWNAPDQWEALHWSLVAMPQFSPPLGEVGYMSYDDVHTPAWVLDESDMKALMQPHRTCYIQVIVPKAVQGVFSWVPSKVDISPET